MIVSFCDPTPQMFCAIEFNGKTLTFFNHPKTLSYEALAFKNYLRSTLSSTGHLCRVKVPNDQREHAHADHAFSSHLQELAHIHLVFNKDIDLPLIKLIIRHIRFYQQKNNQAIRQVWQNTAADDLKETAEIVNHETLAHKIFAWMTGLLTMQFNGIDVISEANLRQLLFEFNNKIDSKDTVLNTRQIMNIFANETQYNNLASLSMPKLQSATCENVNNLVSTRQADHRFYEKSSTVAAYGLVGVLALATGVTLFSLQRYLCPLQNKKNPPAKALKRR